MKLKTIIGGTLSVAFASAFIQASLPKGVDTTSIDKSIAPQTDFFQYANGNWIKTIRFRLLRVVGARLTLLPNVTTNF